jgi:hypothetical protein
MAKDFNITLTIQQTSDNLFVCRTYDGNELVPGDNFLINHGSFDEVKTLYDRLVAVYPGVPIRVTII